MNLFSLTWPEFLPGRIDFYLRLGSYNQLLAHLLRSGFGGAEHFDEGLVVHEGALRGGQPVQQVVLQLLHAALVASHLLQQVRALCFQFLDDARLMKLNEEKEIRLHKINV